MSKRIKTTEIARALFEEAKGKDHTAVDLLTTNTVKLLAKGELAKDGEAVLQELERLENDEAKIVQAEVESKGSLGEHESKEIEDFIHHKFPHHHVSLSHTVNPNIIGGVKIKIGDEVWDLTLNRQLSNLKTHLVTEV